MANPPSDVGIDVGQVLQGKYRVEAILGHGGMGVVVECTHLGLNERYALKVLRQDVLSDHDAVQRFGREARAAANLKSEYVARVSDVGTFDNGLPYMVMEYLEGQDIGALLDDRGKLPMAWATELILQAAEALCEAHSTGIVHRDVKPSNLFVTWRPDGSALVKVLDFGISKSSVGTDMKLTQTQSVLGTPAYMSPEQMRSAHMVDSRSDIWSLGTVLYEMIEGHRPFEADSFSEMCVKVAVDPPQPMTVAPPALAQIVLRCLEKQPDARFPTMGDLGRELVPFAQNPQQAQHLVDRMTRMLRRSQILWEGDPASSMPSLRMAAAAVPSVAGAPASGGTALGYAPGGPTTANPVPRATGSAIIAVPRRRVWPAVAAIALVACAAAGIGIAMFAATSDDPRYGLPQAFIDQAYIAPPTPKLVVVAPQPLTPVVVTPPPTPVVVTPPGSKFRPPHVKQAAATGSGSAAAALPPCDPYHSQHGEPCAP